MERTSDISFSNSGTACSDGFAATADLTEEVTGTLLATGLTNAGLEASGPACTGLITAGFAKTGSDSRNGFLRAANAASVSGDRAEPSSETSSSTWVSSSPAPTGGITSGCLTLPKPSDSCATRLSISAPSRARISLPPLTALLERITASGPNALLTMARASRELAAKNRLTFMLDLQ